MMMKHSYTGESGTAEGNGIGKIFVNFRDSPRLNVQLKDLGKWQNGLFPSHLVFIILTASTVS